MLQCLWMSQFADNKAKVRISKLVLHKNKARQIFRKTNISYPLIYARTFFGKFGVLCFLVTPVLRFTLLPYCRRIIPDLDFAGVWQDWFSRPKSCFKLPSLVWAAVKSLENKSALHNILLNLSAHRFEIWYR